MIDIRVGFEETGEFFTRHFDAHDLRAIDVAELVCDKWKWHALFSLATSKVCYFFADGSADKFANALWVLFAIARVA